MQAYTEFLECVSKFRDNLNVSNISLNHNAGAFYVSFWVRGKNKSHFRVLYKEYVKNPEKFNQYLFPVSEVSTALNLDGDI